MHLSTVTVDGKRHQSTIIGDIVLYYEPHHRRWAQQSGSPLLREYHARAEGAGDIPTLAAIALELCPDILAQNGGAENLTRIKDTNVLHLRSGDIFKSADYVNRQPPSVAHLAALKHASFPESEPSVIVTGLHWTTPEATKKSLKFVHDLQAAAEFDDVESGSPDVDWCTNVLAKRLIVGKGGFSRTAGLVREELGLQTIWDRAACTYDYDERPNALPIPYDSGTI